MDWANERYVRLYTRETTTYRLLGFEGQAMLAPVLRLMDRSGVLDLGGVSAVDALKAHLVAWPTEFIGAGLDALVERGIVRVTDEAIVWPKYIEAQETPQSNAQRNREWRAKRRDEMSRERDETSRDRDETSRERDETDSLCAKPSQTIPPKPPRGSRGALNSTQVERFNRWYSHYPKKVARGAAESAWAKLDPDDVLTERMVRAVVAQREQPRWQEDGGRYVPNPATWLNQKRWLDEVERPAPRKTGFVGQ